MDDLLSPPLARWDGLHLALDLDRVKRHVDELLSAREDLRDLSLRGEGDALAAEVTILWKGIPARSLHIWFGSGGLRELPGRGSLRLPANTEPE